MTFEERKREVLKLIREIQKERVGENKRCLLRILEIGSADLAGFFSMGHFTWALLEDPAEAVAATRRWPYLKVVVAGLGMDPDIVIRGDRITRGGQDVQSGRCALQDA